MDGRLVARVPAAGALTSFLSPGGMRAPGALHDGGLAGPGSADTPAHCPLCVLGASWPGVTARKSSESRHWWEVARVISREWCTVLSPLLGRLLAVAGPQRRGVELLVTPGRCEHRSRPAHSWAGHNCPSRLQIASPGRPICVNPPSASKHDWRTPGAPHPS